MKMHFKFVCCVAALIPLIAPRASTQTPTPSSSGIEGVIMVSPSRPGPIRKDRPSAAPAGNIEFVVKNVDARVASFTTDAEGRFRISLPPGHYTILREDPGARIGHWRFEAEVKSDEITKVQWVGDSGMR
jgi:hypothetical protein